MWPADKVERRPVAGLIPYARNARTHSPDQVRQLAASIREWGWTMPVLVDEGDGIIAGHGRVLAAEVLGITHVPCMVAHGWSEAQRRAYVLADNKLALNAGWDNDLLRVELSDLQARGFDVGLAGFSEADLEGLTDLGAPLDGESEDEGAGLDDEGAGRGMGSLSDRFGVPPFSVLTAREGWWQDRKRAWIALGIRSEVGRGENLIQRSLQERVSMLLPSPAYQAARDLVDAERARLGKDFDESELLARLTQERAARQAAAEAGA